MSRGRQVVRQWKVLRLLEGARHGMRVEELRRALGEDANIRTLYRDLGQLEEAGFPLVDDDGRWRMLVEQASPWRVPIEPSQVLALAVAEDLVDPSRGGPLAEALRDLRQRLEASLTDGGRKWLEELRHTVQATMTGVPDLASSAETQEAMEQALQEHRQVRIEYWSPDSGESERVIEPYFLWIHGNRPYVVGWDRLRDARRTFAVQRIRTATLLETRFEPDPTFDPQDYVRRGFGVLHGPVRRIVVELDEKVAHVVRERTWHHSQRLEATASGVRATWHMGGIPEIARWLAQFGGRIRVLEPQELIEALRSLHVAGLAALTDGVVTSDVTPGG